MQFCPRCGKENSPEAAFCNSCGNQLSASTNTVSAAPQYRDAQYPLPQPMPSFTSYVIFGVISALISLLFIPPLFGIIAIACGGYILSKSNEGSQKQLGWFVVILGAICMFIGFILGVISVLS